MFGRIVLILSAFWLLSPLCLAERALLTKDGRAAVASVNALASQAGVQAISAGGNAIDAAVAMAYTLGVVDGNNSGVGGGCFILVRLSSGEIVAIDGREMAPAAASRKLFIDKGRYQAEWSKTGALASGVPGSVMALEKLHGLGGKLKLNELILPAAELADKGFAVSSILASRLNSLAPKLALFPASKKIFVKPSGKGWQAGDTLVQRDLASTYRQLAKQGSDYFYKGAFAQQVGAWMRANGGIVGASDYAAYRVVNRKPIVSTFNGYTIYGFPPPSSGGIAVAHILALIEQSGFDYRRLDSADQYHLLIESMRLAFADRAHWLGDADFVSVPKNLTSPGYARSRIRGVSLKTAAPNVGYGVPKNAGEEILNKHTTHLTAADASGNWIAITTTLNTSFGSKVTIPGTGVLLNNQMDDFSAQPGTANAFGLLGAEANSIQPRKRPLSSMSPTLVLKDGHPVLTVGAAGGPTIISQVVQGILNFVMLEMPLDAAIARARVHHQWQPNKVLADKNLDKRIQLELVKKGHEMVEWPNFGATQAIAIKKGRFTAVSDPRLDAR